MPDYSNHTITSRMEAILDSMVKGLDYLEDPQSVVEYLLIQLNDKIKHMSSAMKPAGSKEFSELGAPSVDTVGLIYNITDAFTTNSYFIDGSGTNYPAGTNVYGIVNENAITGEEEYYWDVFGAAIDLSAYLTKTEAASTYLSQTDAASTYMTQASATTTFIDNDMIGAPNGVCPLDVNGDLSFSAVGVGTISSQDLSDMWDGTYGD